MRHTIPFFEFRCVFQPEVGGKVGYDNAGKFTEAFKRIMKLTPSEYRKERGISYET